MLNINPPPTLKGDEKAQLTQVYRYLFKLSEELNAVSASLDGQTGKAIEAISKAAGVTPQSNAQGNEQDNNHYASLVALVIKTADIVSMQMDQVVTNLASKYVAESEFGIYQEEVSREIEETAKRTVENFMYDAKVESLTPGEEAAFDTHLEGFIVRGIIDFEDDGTPIIGIAIGREMLKKTKKVGDEVFEMIDTTTNMATYTADKLSFWINGIETAYMSNGELYITRAIILDSIKLGGWDLNVNGKNELEVKSMIGSSIILTANDVIKLLIGTNDNINMWFDFSTDGLIIRKKGIRWKTITDEQGYQIISEGEPSPAGAFRADGLQTVGVTMGDIVCKRTATGGWVWTDAAQGGE